MLPVSVRVSRASPNRKEEIAAKRASSRSLMVQKDTYFGSAYNKNRRVQILI